MLPQGGVVRGEPFAVVHDPRVIASARTATAAIDRSSTGGICQAR